MASIAGAARWTTGPSRPVVWLIARRWGRPTPEGS